MEVEPLIKKEPPSAQTCVYVRACDPGGRFRDTSCWLQRGWTTWTTGAVADKRVIAIVPIVEDALNLHKVSIVHDSTYYALKGRVKHFEVR
jgi:hypothetical protein